MEAWTVAVHAWAATAHWRLWAVAGRSHPTPKARGGSWKETSHGRGQGRRPGRATHIQGAVAALVQEGLEELYHVEGQEGQW